MSSDNDFASRYGPWALIAGASEGVGAEFSDQVAAQGVNLVLVARRPGPLEELAEKIESRHAVQVRTVPLDLSLPDSDLRLFDATKDLEVGLLIYSVGTDNRGQAFLDVGTDEWLGLLRRNCALPILTAHHYGHAMVERGHGGIMILSATGGLIGSAYLAVYRATKAFDVMFAESLWAEFAPKGVDVLGYLLGATSAPEFNRTLERAGIAMECADPKDVAREGLEQLAFGPSYIYGENNRVNVSALPHVDRRNAVVSTSRAVARIYMRPAPWS